MLKPRRVVLVFSGCLVLGGAGCNALKLQPLTNDRPVRPVKGPAPAEPVRHEQRVSQFLFHSDFDLKREQPLFDDLSELRERVFRELRLPPTSTLIQVYLFENRDRYDQFMKLRYPDLPRRRAFFVAQPRAGGEDLLVFTHWGDRVQEDLRHELTHALLHSVLKDVPLWLDEGLAEYFELSPGAKGLNAQHLEQLRHASPPFRADLARLEQLAQVQQMAPQEYREAWAWVHLMLNDRLESRQVLLEYVQQLRTTPNPGPLRPRLAAVYPEPERVLETHLGKLEAAIPTAQR